MLAKSAACDRCADEALLAQMLPHRSRADADCLHSLLELLPRYAKLFCPVGQFVAFMHVDAAAVGGTALARIVTHAQ
jgi:hypothetical protein